MSSRRVARLKPACLSRIPVLKPVASAPLSLPSGPAEILLSILDQLYRRGSVTQLEQREDKGELGTADGTP